MPSTEEVDLIGQLVVTSDGTKRTRTVTVSDQVVTEYGQERIQLQRNTLNQQVSFVGVGSSTARMAVWLETDKKIRVKFGSNHNDNKGVIIPANSFLLCEIIDTSSIYLSNESTSILDDAVVDIAVYKF